MYVIVLNAMANAVYSEMSIDRYNNVYAQVDAQM